MASPRDPLFLKPLPGLAFGDHPHGGARVLTALLATTLEAAQHVARVLAEGGTF
jgi:hypothetical protein